MRSLLARWKHRRAKTAQCEVCGQWFRPSKAVEITDTQPGKFGFTSITITLCKRAPHCMAPDPFNRERLAEIAALLERTKEAA